MNKKESKQRGKKEEWFFKSICVIVSDSCILVDIAGWTRKRRERISWKFTDLILEIGWFLWEFVQVLRDCLLFLVKSFLVFLKEESTRRLLWNYFYCLLITGFQLLGASFVILYFKNSFLNSKGTRRLLFLNIEIKKCLNWRILKSLSESNLWPKFLFNFSRDSFQFKILNLSLSLIFKLSKWQQ